MTKLIEEDGFDEEIVVEHIQTAAEMGGPISETERLLLDRKIRHGNHEVLRSCASNTIVYQDAGGRRRFDKRKSTEKIDLAVAMVMGVWHAVQAEAVGESFYETHGLEVAR
jgi:phage terminase large subunit-like protein